VAQPGSAPEWGSGGPEFKSPRPDQLSEGRNLKCDHFKSGEKGRAVNPSKRLTAFVVLGADEYIGNFFS
jgi:hypothetical protein